MRRSVWRWCAEQEANHQMPIGLLQHLVDGIAWRKLFMQHSWRCKCAAAFWTSIVTICSAFQWRSYNWFTLDCITCASVCFEGPRTSTVEQRFFKNYSFKVNCAQIVANRLVAHVTLVTLTERRTADAYVLTRSLFSQHLKSTDAFLIFFSLKSESTRQNREKYSLNF